MDENSAKVSLPYNVHMAVVQYLMTRPAHEVLDIINTVRSTAQIEGPSVLHPVPGSDTL